MGHERVGSLPKSQKWRDIVQQVAGLESRMGMPSTGDSGSSISKKSNDLSKDLAESEVSDIASNTIKNVSSKLRNLQYDESFKSAFKFLVCFSIAARGNNPSQKLHEFGIEVPVNPSPLSFSRAIRDWMEKAENKSLEYKNLAQSSAVDTIAIWFYINRSNSSQLQLFSGLVDPHETWRKAGDGSGFCELSRLFFSKFTERYLNYFLEREASSVLSSLDARNLFSDQL